LSKLTDDERMEFYKSPLGWSFATDDKSVSFGMRVAGEVGIEKVVRAVARLDVAMQRWSFVVRVDENVVYRSTDEKGQAWEAYQEARTGPDWGIRINKTVLKRRRKKK